MAIRDRGVHILLSSFGLGLLMVWVRPLKSSTGNINARTYRHNLDNSVFPTLQQQFGGRLFPVLKGSFTRILVTVV